MYIFLVVIMRIGGKRQIGELQLSELVTALLLSEIATAPIIDTEKSFLVAVIPICTVIILEIIITFLTTKSSIMKKIFDGSPSIVIEKGKLDQRELGRLRMSVEELIGECRQAGICDMADVEYAVLEENGKFSFFQKTENGEKERGIAHTLIVDGHISENGLRFSGMSEEQLLNELKERKLVLCNVFLYTVNDAGERNILIKEK